MKPIYLPSVVDGALTLVFSFFAFFTVFLSFKWSVAPALIVGISLSLGFSFFVTRFAIKRRVALSLGNDDVNSVALMRKLNVCTLDEKLRIFCSVFNDMGIRTSVDGMHILAGDSGLCVILALYPESLSANELARLIDNAPVKERSKIAVVNAAFTAEAALFADRIGVTLFSSKSIYNLLKGRKIAQPPETEKPQKFFSGIIRGLTAKNNGVKFILFGLSLIAMGFIVFYPVYYYVIGGLMTALGIVQLLFIKPALPKENKTIPDFIRGATT